MNVGLDIGSSLTKMVRDSEDARGLSYIRDPHGIAGGSGMGRQAMVDLARKLAADGVTMIGLTGTGAARFHKVAAAISGMPRTVLGAAADMMTNEIELQASGVKRLLTAQGDASERFMAVSIGTGTSFTLVDGGKIRQYMPGLALGGRTMARLAGLASVEVGHLDEVARKGIDSDLLMKHIDPTVRFPTSEFVVASLGRLGEEGIPASAENVAAGAIKCVATAVAGHLMSIRNHPDWTWDGPTAFIGTPVEKSRVLREWLQLFSLGLKLQCVFPERGSFAGALAAYHLAAESQGQAGRDEPPTCALRRLMNNISRRAGLTGLVVRKALKRG